MEVVDVLAPFLMPLAYSWHVLAAATQSTENRRKTMGAYDVTGTTLNSQRVVIRQIKRSSLAHPDPKLKFHIADITDIGVLLMDHTSLPNRLYGLTCREFHSTNGLERLSISKSY